MTLAEMNKGFGDDWFTDPKRPEPGTYLIFVSENEVDVRLVNIANVVETGNDERGLWLSEYVGEGEFDGDLEADNDDVVTYYLSKYEARGAQLITFK